MHGFRPPMFEPFATHIATIRDFNNAMPCGCIGYISTWNICGASGAAEVLAECQQCGCVITRSELKGLEPLL